MNEAAIIAILIFSGLVFFILSLFLHLKMRGAKDRIIKTIEKYGIPETPESVKSFSAENLGTIKHFFVNLATRLAPYSAPKADKDLTHLRKKLIMAGYNKSNTAIVFYGSKILLAILLPAAFYLVLGFFNIMSGKVIVVMMLVLALVGFYLPEVWVQVAISAWQNKIREEFPDALDLLVVCVEAGMGLDQAIKRVSDEMQQRNKVISEVFGQMSLEMRAGRSRQEAMRNLGARTGVEDVKSLVTLLIQTDKFGTSIAQALRVHSSSMRTKRRQRAEELAAKLPVKLLFPLILFIFPSLFVIIIGPGAIRIYRALIQSSFGG
ncbi:MAG: type II secretion system F family protein, partial [Syntrophales bacterium]|jgi:tight adherence protein C